MTASCLSDASDLSARVDAIDALLPQTQCTQCGYDGCRPYAAAIARGEAGIERCPPGGDAGVARLAALLDVPRVPLDPARGAHKPRHVAVIDERHCIGCTLCIRACPVEAIVGANKFMHVVLPELCSGCELCIAPCPVDCIAMVPARAWDGADADGARARHQARERRMRADASPADAAPAAARTPSPQPAAATPDTRKQDMIALALARARARRAQPQP